LNCKYSDEASDQGGPAGPGGASCAGYCWKDNTKLLNGITNVRPYPDLMSMLIVLRYRFVRGSHKPVARSDEVGEEDLVKRDITQRLYGFLY